MSDLANGGSGLDRSRPACTAAGDDSDPRQAPAAMPLDARGAPARTHLVDLSDGRTLEMRPHACFACGELNSHGLHLRLHVDTGTCWSEPVLEERFAGWQGIAHGGIVSAILDEVMAWSLLDEDCWGVTARMSLEFRNPVPVGRPLRAEGRVVERRRRLFRTEGRLVDRETGTLYATAEGTYVDAPRARKDELKRRYGYRLLSEDGRVLEEAPDGTAESGNGMPGAGAAAPSGRDVPRTDVPPSSHGNLVGRALPGEAGGERPTAGPAAPGEGSATAMPSAVVPA